jgi:arabinogalactan oligomer / maltooligosaccharide transport system permease protein
MASVSQAARVGGRVRRRGILSRIAFGEHSEKRLPLGRQIALQLVCLFIAATVLFPIVWIVSLSLDPRNIARPSELTLIPPGASFAAYQAVLDKPTSNPVTFWTLATNSFKLAAGVSALSVLLGVSAAYAFSRFRFRGRQGLMLTIVAVLAIPSTATIAPLFVMLNRVQVGFRWFNLLLMILGGVLIATAILLLVSRFREGSVDALAAALAALGIVVGLLMLRGGLAPIPEERPDFNLRNSLFGLGLAMISGALPFAIWNLKGYLDTIPKDLEEAAIIDGATANQTFFRVILPLSAPALAVTGFLGFLTGWTEFALSWQFLTNPNDFTLTMSLYNMTGQYAGSVPWSKFAAMSILLALPVSAVYLALQRYIVGGLTLGGVKG